VSRLHDCVLGVSGVPVGTRIRHRFTPTQEFCIRSLLLDAVDPGLHVQANRTVRPDTLVRNDLVRTAPTPDIPPARIAGHSSITITQRYVHPRADSIERTFQPTAKAALPSRVGTKLGTKRKRPIQGRP
jgi:hypothetical protein